jgi:hypothetical protein
MAAREDDVDLVRSRDDRHQRARLRADEAAVDLEHRARLELDLESTEALARPRRQEALDDEWGAIQAEKARLRTLAQGLLDKQQSAGMAAPTSAAEAADLLGLGPRPSPDEVERAWRRQVARCHPDRVADLHPDLQQRAADMTVALNAAREILLGKQTARRR